MHRSCSPTQAHTSTGRLCSAGSARHRVPQRLRSYAALRLPRPLRPPLRSPSPTAYPGAEVFSFTVAPAPPPARATPETLLPRLPSRRLSPREKRGPPRCLGHPLRACRGPRPRRVRCAPRPAIGALAVAFRPSETLSTRNAFSFVATYPRPTRSRTYASPIPLPYPAQGSLPVGRAHP